MDNNLLGNRYEIIKEIGAGGMARVYKARCTLLNRYVAVKILKEDFASDPDFLKRFTYEAQAAAGLSHQNIVSIYDVGSDKGENYIVMEYVDGITLKKYLQDKGGTLSEKETLEISLQVCKALSHAHKNGVIHRDIKPHNIIIQEDGVIKVADFGIARASNSATVTLAGNTIGSVHYFSPEQARGLATDAKSDLYSLGATIYELMTGKLVFDADTPIAIALKHVQEEPVEPVKHDPRISYNMNTLVMRLLSKDPGDRYESAAELQKQIERMLYQPGKRIQELKNESVSPENIPDSRPRMKRKKRKKRLDSQDIMTTIIAVIVSIVSVTLFAYLVFGIIIPSLDTAMEEINDVVIDNYVGDRIENVTRILDRHKIEIIRDEIYDENSNPGIVLSQSINPGSTLKEGARITLTISLGPEYVTYRDLTYVDYREAVKELEDLGLKVDIVSEYNDVIPNGQVILTEPAAGTRLRLGTEVTLIRSLGVEIIYVLMPKLLELTYVEALELIESHNLELDLAVNYGKEGYSDIISYQSPSPDVRIPEGTKVTVFVKKLTEVEPPPEETDPEQTEPVETTPSETTTVQDENFYFLEYEIDLEGIQIPELFGFAVETRTSLEDTYSIHFMGEIKEEELPYHIIIKVPKNGFTDIRVYVDNAFVKEMRIESPVEGD